MRLPDLLNSEEDNGLEYKPQSKLEDTNEIARQLVAFANREGGHLIFGVDDSGDVEGKSIDFDQAGQRISNIARNNCSPPIVFESYYRPLPDGDIVHIEVERMDGIPHAVVSRKGDRIESRTYYIRTGNTTRLVSDSDLRLLFKGEGFGDISYETYWWWVGHEETLGHPRIELPRASKKAIFLTDTLTESDKEFLLNDYRRDGIDNERLREYISVVTPILFLSMLSRSHSASWKGEWQDIGTGFSMRWDSDVPKQEMSFEEVEYSGFDDSILKDIESDPRNANFLQHPSSFATPPNTNVTVEYNPKQSLDSEIRFVRSGLFTISIKFSINSYGVDLPLRHPEATWDRVDPDSKYRNCNVQIRLNSEFSHPDTPDPNIKYHRLYSQKLVEFIEESWAVPNMLDGLPDQKIYEIDRKAEDILRALGVTNMEDN